MVNDFITWLTTEIDERGWTNSELARRAGLTPSAISLVISEKRKPGQRLCRGIARAFGLNPIEVFRRANLLPSVPRAVAEEREAILYLRIMPPEMRDIILIQMRSLVERLPEGITTEALDRASAYNENDDELGEFIEGGRKLISRSAFYEGMYRLLSECDLPTRQRLLEDLKCLTAKEGGT